jgi:hypothetical protein
MAGRPRTNYRSREEDLAHKRQYARERRDAIAAGRHVVREQPIPFAEYVRDAKYNPHRDGPLCWADFQAFLFGDPPIGRRAIDRLSAQACRRLCDG